MMVVLGVVAVLALMLVPAYTDRLVREQVNEALPLALEDAPVVPVTWLCGFAAVPEKMAAKTANRTDIPKGYLPVKCR